MQSLTLLLCSICSLCQISPQGHRVDLIWNLRSPGDEWKLTKLFSWFLFHLILWNIWFYTLQCMCQGLTKVGSLFRQDSMNSLKLFEKSPISVGAGNLGMWKRTRIGCMSELGGSPLASSMAVMPRDQISAWRTENTQQQLLLDASQVVLAVYTEYALKVVLRTFVLYYSCSVHTTQFYICECKHRLSCFGWK